MLVFRELSGHRMTTGFGPFELPLKNNEHKSWLTDNLLRLME